MAIGMKENNETTETVERLTETDLDSPPSNKNNLVLIGIIAVVAIILISMLQSIFKKEEPIDLVDDGTGSNVATTQAISTESNNTDAQLTTEISGDDGITIGLPEFDPKENGQTTAVVYSASDYIKDLNGLDIPAVYEISTRTYVRDFVNYEAKRAIIADGMEMYWLEILYEGKPYRCQVPFYIFQNLDTTGICVVEIELLTLAGGEQVISFMQVVTDYTDLINK